MYIEVDVRSLKFEVCGSGRFTFFGEVLGKVIVLPACKFSRYYNCTTKFVAMNDIENVIIQDGKADTCFVIIKLIIFILLK